MAETSPATTACPYCLSVFDDATDVTNCPACHTRYHSECWKENGGCAIYGCSQVPVVESRQGIEVPVSYWGQENKPCPACQKEILAAARRCRHCGVTFASARPENASEFQSRAVIEAAGADSRRSVIWIFVVSILPFTAPAGAIWGWWWTRSNQDSVRALPAIYGALSRIGFYVALVQTGLIAVLTALYVAFRA